METLLQIWPSIRAIADDLKRPYPTVQSWGVAGRRIPPDVFPELIAAAKARGADLTYEALIAANSAAKGDAA